MTMELYKEREINPFASIGILIVQLPILIGLYSGLNRIIKDPHEIISFSYSWMQDLSWMQTLAHDIHRFDDSLLGFVNLGRKAADQHGIYWPALAIVALSAVFQYYQSKQLMPQPKESRGLRQILREAGQGKQADQAEVSAAVGRGTLLLVPGMVFIFGLNFAAALPLYWLATSVIAYIQQSRILKVDAAEADASVPAVAAKTSGGLKVTRKTVDESANKPKPKKKKTSKTQKGNRRRRK
jgi:membrane protein insertase Oxa1/YidC/SpoIIIJ